LTKQVKRADNLVHLQTRPITRRIRLAEDIVEQSLEPIEDTTVGISGNRIAGTQGKGAQIVNAMDMIGVSVSKENTIDLFDPLTQSLLTKIGRRIDQNLAT
jgi:hypothetical protein